MKWIILISALLCSCVASNPKQLAEHRAQMAADEEVADLSDRQKLVHKHTQTCLVIGYKPETPGMRDCVTKLVAKPEPVCIRKGIFRDCQR